MVHSSSRPICHLSEPQTSNVCIPCSRPTSMEKDPLNINWSGLIAYTYPATALLHWVKSEAGQGCPDLGPSAALNRIPTPITNVKDTPQAVSQPNVSQQPTICLPSRSSKNKVSLWNWQQESGLYLNNGVERIWWSSPHLL